MIDFAKVTPASEYNAETATETTEVREMLAEAGEYLESFPWCQGITAAYTGIAVAGVIGVFLFHLVPSRRDVDEWVWVIVGDLPPAYITIEDTPNPATAIDAYIGAMQEWVSAAASGQSVDDLIPVNVPATEESAKLLEKRLQLLDDLILADYRDDLRARSRQ